MKQIRFELSSEQTLRLEELRSALTKTISPGENFELPVVQHAGCGAVCMPGCTAGCVAACRSNCSGDCMGKCEGTCGIKCGHGLMQ